MAAVSMAVATEASEVRIAARLVTAAQAALSLLLRGNMDVAFRRAVEASFRTVWTDPLASPAGRHALTTAAAANQTPSMLFRRFKNRQGGGGLWLVVLRNLLQMSSMNHRSPRILSSRRTPHCEQDR